jgi:endonuclease YncB( thermonuclease family)
MKELFKNYNYNTPYFSLNGKKCYTRVVNIIDGDTIVLVIELFENTYYKFNVRLDGIDTSELKSKDEKLKQKALEAKYKLVELICNVDKNFDFTKENIKKLLDDNIYLIWTECLEFDKYGRLLAKIKNTENDNEYINNILIDENLAYEYHGGKKM